MRKTVSELPDIYSVEHLSPPEIERLKQQNIKQPNKRFEFYKSMHAKLSDDYKSTLQNKDFHGYFSMVSRFQWNDERKSHLADIFLHHNPQLLPDLLKILSPIDKSILARFQLAYDPPVDNYISPIHLDDGNTLLHSVLQIPGGLDFNLKSLFEGGFTTADFDYMLRTPNQGGETGLSLALKANIRLEAFRTLINCMDSRKGISYSPEAILQFARVKPAMALVLIKKFPFSFRENRQGLVDGIEAIIFHLYNTTNQAAMALEFFTYFNNLPEFKKALEAIMPMPAPPSLDTTSPGWSGLTSSVSSFMSGAARGTMSYLYGTAESSHNATTHPPDRFQLKVLLIAAFCCSSDKDFLTLYHPSSTPDSIRQPPCNLASIKALQKISLKPTDNPLRTLLANIPPQEHEIYTQRFQSRLHLWKMQGYLVERYEKSGILLDPLSDAEARMKHFIAAIELLADSNLAQAQKHLETAEATFGKGTYTSHCKELLRILSKMSEITAYEMVATYGRFCLRLQSKNVSTYAPIPYQDDFVLTPAENTFISRVLAATRNKSSKAEFPERLAASLNALLQRSSSLGEQTPSNLGNYSNSLSRPNYRDSLDRTPSGNNLHSMGQNKGSLPNGTPMGSIERKESSSLSSGGPSSLTSNSEGDSPYSRRTSLPAYSCFTSQRPLTPTIEITEKSCFGSPELLDNGILLNEIASDDESLNSDFEDDFDFDMPFIHGENDAVKAAKSQYYTPSSSPGSPASKLRGSRMR